MRFLIRAEVKFHARWHVSLNYPWRGKGAAYILCIAFTLYSVTWQGQLSPKVLPEGLDMWLSSSLPAQALRVSKLWQRYWSIPTFVFLNSVFLSTKEHTSWWSTTIELRARRVKSIFALANENCSSPLVIVGVALLPGERRRKAPAAELETPTRQPSFPCQFLKRLALLNGLALVWAASWGWGLQRRTKTYTFLETGGVLLLGQVH